MVKAKDLLGLEWTTVRAQPQQICDFCSREIFDEWCEGRTGRSRRYMHTPVAVCCKSCALEAGIKW